MSDEPYTFGPTDPPAHGEPSGPPEAGAVPEVRAWGYVPDAPSVALPAAGAPGNPAGAPDHPVPNPAPNGAPAAWGAAPPAEGRKRMSTMAKSLTAVGVAAVIAVGGTVAVTSANADNTTASSAVTQATGGGGYGSTGSSGSTGTGGTDGTGRQGGFGGGMASRSLLAGALHGEFVVADGTGTVTERLQTGAVTSISSSSLTVKSSDDFTGSYSIPAGTDVSALATGTTVTVIAKVDGSTLTIVSIMATEAGSMGAGGAGGITSPDGSGSSGSGGSGSGGSGSEQLRVWELRVWHDGHWFGRYWWVGLRRHRGPPQAAPRRVVAPPAPQARAPASDARAPARRTSHLLSPRHTSSAHAACA